MKDPKKCKRGNIPIRSKDGHCICTDCREYNRAHATRHSKEYQKAWREKNKDKTAAYTKKWNDKFPEKRRAIEKSWKSRNPDKVKLHQKRRRKDWWKRNKGRAAAKDMRRKAAKKNRTPSWANLDKIREFYIEAARLTKETGIPHEVDHIIPLQGEFISGLHVHNNLQILTRSENRSKKNKIELS